MNHYFDLLLIHADSQFQRLEETFPPAGQIKCAVSRPGADSSATRRQPASIVVSIGGGRVGYELLECAIEARARLAESLPHQMQVFAGPHMPEDQFLRLQGLAAGRTNITVERPGAGLPVYRQ
jgi:predicted glycosyltransferase